MKLKVVQLVLDYKLPLMMLFVSIKSPCKPLVKMVTSIMKEPCKFYLLLKLVIIGGVVMVITSD